MSRTRALFLQLFSFLTLVLISPLLLGIFAKAQVNSANPFSAQPRDRITSFIDEEQRVALRGNLHPLANARYDVGMVAADYPMERMILTLLPDSSQGQTLDEFVSSLYNAESPSYHQWLTPSEYAERFGASNSDVTQIVDWLRSHGFESIDVSIGRQAIVFSGTAAQVRAAFHTSIHAYNVAGEIHHANAQEPEIPLALAQVVGGVVSLHDFRSSVMHRPVGKIAPQFTSGGSHYLAPPDFATIYDLGPAYQQSINGSGQSVAIVARSNIRLTDVAQFRSSFGLPANSPQIILNGPDPGIWDANEETEADLDAEWSGAVAKNATIKFVVSKSTNTTDGVDLSAQYIVDNNLAPVMSTSFGLCEAWLGAAGNTFLNNLWEQAAVQGITVFVSSGDNGAAGCDSSSESSAVEGLAVNGLCSTPYSVCVGGNEFNDTANPALYWSASNASGTQGSALSYIPEVVWNESGPTAGLWASGGGASTVYSKPAWQTGVGVPADGKRDVPDVSLSAAGHDGYLIVQEGGLYVVGGTSAASPSFAGIMGLVVQSAASRQGNANAVFYPLAAKQRSGGAAIFHDITSGNNSVPGLTGFNATIGYDQATGLGSVDASVLVAHWSDGTIVPSYHASATSNSLSVIDGSNNSVPLNVTVSGGFNASVSFSVAGVPGGVSASFTATILPAPGSGASALKLTAATGAKPGSYSLTITAASGSLKQTIPLSLTVEPAPTFSLSASAGSMTTAPGSSANLTLTTTPNSTFNSSITFSLSGLPSGVTAQFLPSSVVSAPGAAATLVTFSASAAAVPKAYSLVLTAVGGGITQKQTLTLNVPGFILTASASSLTVSSSAKGALKVTTSAAGGFNSAISFSVSGLPPNLSATFSPASVASPGNGSSTLTLTKQVGASTGNSRFTVTASGKSLNEQSTIALTVK